MDDPMREIIARTNASAYLPPLGHEEKQPRERRRREHRIVRRAGAELTPAQVQLLIALLKSERALVYLSGVPYAVRRTPDGWSVRGLGPADIDYYMDAELASCTCPDSKFRGRQCKHAMAVRASVGGDS